MSSEKKKILFITCYYGKLMTPTDVCVKNLAIELSCKGHRVYILSKRLKQDRKTEIQDGIQIYRYPAGIYHNLHQYALRNQNKILGKAAFAVTRALGIRMLLFLPIFPVRDPLLIRRCCRNAGKLHREINFDLVIGAYGRMEAVAAAGYLKKKHGVTTCSYFVDSLSDNASYRFLSSDFINKQGRKHEKNIYENSDLILNMRCHERNFTHPRYDIYQNKMRITDFPLLRQSMSEESNRTDRISKEHGSDIIAVYTGEVRVSLLPHIIETFENAGNIKLHIYSKTLLTGFDTSVLVKHGAVTHAEALTAQNCADILISMGNRESADVPSKIFEYISTGKRIIHFCFNNKDSCVYYYEKYRNALIVNIEDGIGENLRKVSRFIGKGIENIGFDELKETFRENLPEHTVSMLSDIL